MTKRRLRVHPEVIDSDLAEAVGYYADLDPSLPERLADDFASGLRRIEAHAAVLSEYLPGWRRVLLRTFPYLLAYAVDDDSVHVVGLFHTHRDPTAIQEALRTRSGDDSVASPTY